MRMSTEEAETFEAHIMKRTRVVQLCHGGEMAVKKSPKRNYPKAAGERAEGAKSGPKRETLKSASGGAGVKVTSQKRVVAVGLSEAQDAGANIPPPPKGGMGQVRARREPRNKK